MDKRPRTIQTRSNPSNAGTKHLGQILSASYRNQVTRKRGKEFQNDQGSITASITDNQGMATRNPLNGYPVIEVTGVEGGDTAVDEREGQI
jgi:hypothetical protein